MPEITSDVELTNVRFDISKLSHKKVKKYKRILREARARRVSIADAYVTLIEEALAANPLLNMEEKGQ